MTSDDVGVSSFTGWSRWGSSPATTRTRQYGLGRVPAERLGQFRHPDTNDSLVAVTAETAGEGRRFLAATSAELRPVTAEVKRVTVVVI
jgi:hypothetical protein